MSEISSGAGVRGTAGADGQKQGISIYALPLMRDPNGSIRYAYIPCQHQEREAPTASTSKKGFLASVTTKAFCAWNALGQYDKKTWARWMYDSGQTIVEDVSPEGRLVKGISPSARSITVLHPSCISMDSVHKELSTIIDSRKKSESWRLVAYSALLVPGLILDNTLLLAFPIPIGAGAAGYKAYSYLAGARGSMHLSKMIKNHNKTNAETSVRDQSGKDLYEEGDSGARPSTSKAATTAEQDPPLNSVRQDSQHRQEEGLAYVPLPSLSPFVSRIEEECKPGDMISGSMINDILSILPEGHREEVQRHLTELRRRHERQLKRQAPNRGASTELAVMQL